MIFKHLTRGMSWRTVFQLAQLNKTYPELNIVETANVLKDQLTA